MTLTIGGDERFVEVSQTVAPSASDGILDAAELVDDLTDLVPFQWIAAFERGAFLQQDHIAGFALLLFIECLVVDA